METPVPRRSFRERIGLKKKAPPPPPPESSSLQLLTTLSPDSWVWEYAAPLANSLGVTSGGVAAGSLAAKAVAAASSASSAGAVVTTLQTIGVATFTTPVGLCLVTTCVVVGGSVLIGRALFSGASKVSEDAWILVEAAASVKKPKFMSKENLAPSKSEPFAVAVFDDEKAARKAFKHSRVKSKALFGPQKTLVLSRQWQEAFRQVVAAM